NYGSVQRTSKPVEPVKRTGCRMTFEGPSFGAVATTNPRKRKELFFSVAEVPPCDRKQKSTVRIMILPNCLNSLGPEPCNGAINGLGIMRHWTDDGVISRARLNSRITARQRKFGNVQRGEINIDCRRGALHSTASDSSESSDVRPCAAFDW